MVNTSLAEDYKQIGSLHDYREWEDKVTHGEWVKHSVGKSSNHGWFNTNSLYY